MPFIRIDLPAGKPSAYATAVSDTVQATLHGVFDVPMTERFHVLAGHRPGTLSIDPPYLGVQRSGDALVIQVTLNRARDAELKQRLCHTLAEALHATPGIRTEDVIVSLVEVGRKDWSFGEGQAQLVLKEAVQ